MRSPFGLAVLLIVCGTGAAFAADRAVPKSEPASDNPVLSVTGTLSPTWTDNALFSRDNRLSDFFWEPDMTVRLDGRLAPDLSWRLYARWSFDQFAEVKDGDEAFALFGGRLTKSFADWRASLIYENRYEFTGIYQHLSFVAHDVKASVGRDFSIGAVTLSPTVLGTYRFSDLAEARRYRLDLLLGIEVKLDSRWSIVSTPFVEGYWFTDGLNFGRRDMIYSGSLGLKYNITEQVSLTGNVAYEARVSNVPLRHYRSLDIGPKLSFAF